jgi:ubiquinone/menaquinone biosynthesis C-methylase UbiE
MQLASLPARIIGKLKRILRPPNSFVKAGYVRAETAKADAAGVPLYEYLEREAPQALRDFRDNSAEALLRSIPPEGRIVEIGTGAGFIAARILKARPGMEYLSFEPEQHLARHLDKWLSRGGGRFRSMKSTGFDLSGVEAGSADAVVVYGVFTVLDMAAIFKYLDEARRVLKPGGILMFDIFDTDQLDGDLLDLIRSQVGRMQSRPYLSGRFLAGYLERLGFAPGEAVPSGHRRYALMHVFRKA